MFPAPSTVVHGLNGLRGTVLATSCPPGDIPSQIAVRLDNGVVVVVPEKRLILQDDGTYFLPMGLDALSPQLSGQPIEALNGPGGAVAAAAVPEGEEILIPRVEERLRVGRSELERTVSIHKTVQQREETVDVPLLREDVEVERVAMNQVVASAPAIRQEGDVTIIPVLEEVLVVEKRLMLREELRVTRRKTERHEPERVVLRSEQISVTRNDEVKNA